MLDQLAIEIRAFKPGGRRKPMAHDVIYHRKYNDESMADALAYFMAIRSAHPDKHYELVLTNWKSRLGDIT